MYSNFSWANNKDADQSVRLRRLICAFADRVKENRFFFLTGRNILVACIETILLKLKHGHYDKWLMFFLGCKCYFLLYVAQAKVGNDLGIASWVNMTRIMFDAMTVLDDGGSGNVLVRLYRINKQSVVGWLV